MSRVLQLKGETPFSLPAFLAAGRQSCDSLFIGRFPQHLRRFFIPGVFFCLCAIFPPQFSRSNKPVEIPIQKTLNPDAAGFPTVGAESPAQPLDALLARLPGLVYRCRYDLVRTVEFASAGSHALLGFAPSELIRDGLGLVSFICPQDRERVQREIAEALALRDTFTCEYHLNHAGNRRRIPVLEQGRAVRDSRGQVIALEGHVGDLAGCARPRRDFQLQQAWGFQSINLLAKGVAHDFNNALAGIVTGAGLIKMEMAANPEQPVGDILEQIFDSNGRAQKMIRQLVEFSQRQPAERTLILLPPVVEASLQALRSVIPATIEITHIIEPECPAILADPAQIQQVVMNLCTHAGRSLAGHKNGRIQVRLDTCDVGTDLAAAQPGLRAGPHVRLAVSNNSAQVSQAVLGRMFEPFACKQADGHNSGLELFAAREIAHAHEGAVTVDMVPGDGFVFHFYFPIPDSL